MLAERPRQRQPGGGAAGSGAHMRTPHFRQRPEGGDRPRGGGADGWGPALCVRRSGDALQGAAFD